MNNSQTPVEQSFDDTELGLQPPNPVNRFLFNYIKALVFTLARDEPNKIWRMLRADNNGNLRIKLGGQSTLPPVATTFSVVAGLPPTKVIGSNTQRTSWMIINDGSTGNNLMQTVLVSYGNQPSAQYFRLDVGMGIRCYSWNGDVFCRGLNSTADIRIVEFF